VETVTLPFTEGETGTRSLARAAAILRDGGLVAFPTETVYGLGALALDPAAVRRIFAAKGRPPTNPLIVHVPGVAEAGAVVAAFPERARRLAAAFWPGPLTLVLPRRPEVPPEVSAGLPTVGVRVPSHPVARALLVAVGRPIAAPSANRYTAISPTSARHVEKSLGGRIDAILDGGETPIGIESTVLDVSGPVPTLLRPGILGIDELSRVVGPIARGPGLVEGEAAVSPGLAKRHYAPAARVAAFAPGGAARALAGLPAGARAGVVARRPRPEGAAVAAWIQLPDEPAGFARQLYGALHALEDAGVSDVLLEGVPEGAEWEAVRDRLGRAAG
jgi:L-threonylcarbamoyladenylate synthase